jgi:peptide/nickel transport system substrate-binding protein
MYRRKTLALIIAFLMVFSVVVTTGSQVAAEYADEIIVAQGADVVSLDPYGQNDQPSSRVRVQIFDTLVLQNKDLEVEPALAESWEQIDELTWEFKLREGVKWHNGEDFKADDVVFSLPRAIASEQVGYIVSMIDKVEKVDDYTVRITTKEPFAPLLAHLSHPAISMMNEKAVTDAGDDVNIQPVGTGPFKFVSWDPGVEVVLERNEEYWGEDLAQTERVIFRPVPENTNRTIELETGNVHIAYDIPPLDVQRVEDDPNLQLFRGMNLSTTYIGFNCDKEPFSDPVVRQAINHAIDMDVVVEQVYHGVGKKASGPLGSNVAFANEDLVPYEYNPELAKQMLEEAGYSDGDINLVIWTNDNQLRMDIAEIVSFQLAEVGINATMEVVEWGAYLQQTGAGEHDMFILGWVTVTGDADYGLYALFHSSNCGEAGNRTFYRNDRVDELLDIGRKAQSDEERAEAYYEAQEIIRDDAPWIFTWNGEDLTGASAKIEGFELHPAGHYRLKNVKLGE